MDSMEKNEPYFITRHIVEIAKAFNKFYNSTPIIIDDEKQKAARLALVYSVMTIIKTGLDLLGIEAPKKM